MRPIFGGVEVIGHEAHQRAKDGVEVNSERADQRRLACGQAALRGQEQHHVAVRKAQGTGVEHTAHTKAQARPECDLALFADLVSHRAPSLFSIVFEQDIEVHTDVCLHVVQGERLARLCAIPYVR